MYFSQLYGFRFARIDFALEEIQILQCRKQMGAYYMSESVSRISHIKNYTFLLRTGLIIWVSYLTGL